MRACPGRATLADASAAKRRSAAPARASHADPTAFNARLSAGPRPPQSRPPPPSALHARLSAGPEPPVEPLHPRVLEVALPRLRRLDREPRVLEPPQHL